MWSLGLLDVDAGAAAEALERLERGRERMVVTGAGLGVQFVDSGIGLARAALGDLDDARETPRCRRGASTRAPSSGPRRSRRIDLAHVERLLGDHASGADKRREGAQHRRAPRSLGAGLAGASPSRGRGQPPGRTGTHGRAPRSPRVG